MSDPRPGTAGAVLPGPADAVPAVPPRQRAASTTTAARPTGAVSAGARPRSDHARRADVQGLRAVAVLLVVIYHAGVRQLAGGYVGVDVFFVISGFVITTGLLGEIGATGRLDIPRFYGRRAIRLLPHAVLVLVTTCVAAWFWLPSTRFRDILLDTLAANGYVINYRLAMIGTDYRTATALPSPLQHFWSLAVEEQFYLFWPLIVLVLMALRVRTARLAAVGVLIAASLAWSMVLTDRSATWAYFGAPTRVWELALGALLAMLMPRPGRPPALTRWPAWPGVLLRWLGLATICGSALWFGPSTPFPGSAALVPVLGAAAVIVAGADGRPGRMLGSGLFGVLGNRSYGWYLWHWPVLVIGPFALSRPFGVRQNLLAVLVALLVAMFFGRLIEDWVRTMPELRDVPRRALSLGAGLTVGCVALAATAVVLPPRIPRGLTRVAAVTLPDQGSAATRQLADRLRQAAGVRDLPANLTPSLQVAPGDTPDVYRNGCHLDFRAVRWPAGCERFGESTAGTLVVLFGDSHAAQWYPALLQIARQRHWRLASFTKAACSAADVKIYLDPLKRAYDECVTWRNAVLARIGQLRPAVVVTSSNFDGGNPIGQSGDLDAVWTAAWTRTLTRLAAPDRKVVYLDDTPWPKENVPDCVALHPRDLPSCAQGTRIAMAGVRRGMMSAAAARAGATVVDPLPWFCTANSCPVVVGNLLIYQDASHITTAYSRLLAPLLAERL